MIYAVKLERQNEAQDFILIVANDAAEARIFAVPSRGERIISVEPFSEAWLTEEFGGAAVLSNP